MAAQPAQGQWCVTQIRKKSLYTLCYDNSLYDLKIANKLKKGILLTRKK